MTRRQRGFTLIELMVALLVSSLLVGMILAIFSRMSLAYRGQQQIAGVQQVLAAARAAIELDAKQAGLAMPQGFTSMPTGGAGTVMSPVQVIDSATGPDQIAFFYADPTTQAVVTAASVWPSLSVDQVTGFAAGDLIVLSTVDTTQTSPFAGEPNITKYTTCAMRLDPVNGVVAGPPARLVIETVAPWGWNAGNGPCAGAPAAGAMVYKLVAHAYKIDVPAAPAPARSALGVLQLSYNGGLLGANDAWNELAYGFTDIQTAERVVLPPPPAVAGTDPDADGDGYRDWYSGAAQNAMNTVPPAAPLAAATLQQISISLVARTDRDIEGVATQTTPPLIVAAKPDNNLLGNHAAVALPSATDPALGGSRIYRYVTFQVDFRNLGVGR
jgi:prepilin-type N-terminal cleavage/methylation domain-containing protein